MSKSEIPGKGAESARLVSRRRSNRKSGIEGFWALLKRGLIGQFHSVTPRHLQRYVDEFCFRYNLRHFEQDDMFTYTIYRCLGVL